MDQITNIDLQYTTRNTWTP